MMKVDQNEIERRVLGYVTRMERGDVVRYSLNDEGVYQISSGSSLNGKGGVLETVEGRFVDVIAYASGLSGFLGDWCSWSLPENCNHGRLERIDIPKVEANKEFDLLIRSSEGIK